MLSGTPKFTFTTRVSSSVKAAVPAATRLPGSTFFSTITPGMGAVRFVSPRLIRAETVCACAACQLPVARLNLPHGSFYIGCRRCVLLHCGVVVRTSHGLRGIQRLGTLKVQIRLCLVGLCPIEFRLRSIQSALRRVLLAHCRIERGFIIGPAQVGQHGAGRYLVPHLHIAHPPIGTLHR